jgi:hypothetical protein
MTHQIVAAWIENGKAHASTWWLTATDANGAKAIDWLTSAQNIMPPAVLYALPADLDDPLGAARQMVMREVAR